MEYEIIRLSRLRLADDLTRFVEARDCDHTGHGKEYQMNDQTILVVDDERSTADAAYFHQRWKPNLKPERLSLLIFRRLLPKPPKDQPS